MINILSVSDKKSNYLENYLVKKSFNSGFDFIFSCGDLSPRYIHFLSSATNKIIYYVNGNHSIFDKTFKEYFKKKYG